MSTLVDWEPGWLADWYYDPCLPTPSVFIKSLYLAIGELGMTLIEPDQKEYFRKATGRSWLKAFKEIATDVESATEVAEFRELETAFSLFEVYDMAIWYAFVASVTNDFLATWTSQIYKLEGCKGDPYHLTAESNEPSGGYTPSHTWTDGPSWIDVKGDWEILTLSGVTAPAGGYAMVSGRLAAYNLLDDTPVGIDTMIANRDGVQVLGTLRTCDDVEKQGANLTWAYGLWGGDHSDYYRLMWRVNPNYSPTLMYFAQGKSFIKVSQTWPHSGPPPVRRIKLKDGNVVRPKAGAVLLPYPR